MSGGLTLESVPESDAAPARGIGAAWTLTVILLLAAILRGYGIGSTPPGLYCDELALGVNAACLGSTGKSLAGEVFPLYVHEKTFGECPIVYQPVFQYSLVPFIRCFGRSPAVVRLPSVLFGLAAVAGVYCLASLLFGRNVGLVAAALLAVSPWHCHFSRVAFEAISLPPLLIFGVYCFLRGLKKLPFLYAGSGLLALATYAYPPARMFVPVLLLGLAAIHFEELCALRKHAVGAALTAAIVFLPNLILILTSRNQSRMYELLVTSRNVLGDPVATALHGVGGESSVAAYVLHRPAVLLPYVYACKYLSHLSPAFLFLSGDSNCRHGARGMGMCFLFYAPLLVLGLSWLLYNRKNPGCRLLLLWFLAWPIPSSLMVESPHAIRAITNFPSLEIIAAIALCLVGKLVRDVLGRYRRPSWQFCTAVSLAFSFMLLSSGEVLRFIVRYHRDYGRTSGVWWEAGIEEAFTLLRREVRQDDQIVVASNVGNPYLSILFFWDVDLRSLDPSVEGFRGLLPPRFSVAKSGEITTITSDSLWLIRSQEISYYPRAVIVGRVCYPDGNIAFLLLRAPPSE